MRGIAYRGRLGAGSASKGIDETRHAVAAAPDLGLAHARLASALALAVATAGWELDQATSQEIRAHVTRAMQLDGDNHIIIGHLVMPYVVLGDPESGLKLAQRAAELNPDSTASCLLLGIANLHLGNTTEAIAAFEQQNRLSSHNLWPDMLPLRTLAFVIFSKAGRLRRKRRLTDRWR